MVSRLSSNLAQVLFQLAQSSGSSLTDDEGSFDQFHRRLDGSGGTSSLDRNTLIFIMGMLALSLALVILLTIVMILSLWYVRQEQKPRHPPAVVTISKGYVVEATQFDHNTKYGAGKGEKLGPEWEGGDGMSSQVGSIFFADSVVAARRNEEDAATVITTGACVLDSTDAESCRSRQIPTGTDDSVYEYLQNDLDDRIAKSKASNMARCPPAATNAAGDDSQSVYTFQQVKDDYEADEATFLSRGIDLA